MRAELELFDQADSTFGNHKQLSCDHLIKSPTITMTHTVASDIMAHVLSNDDILLPEGENRNH